jgi:hypothetical protein
MTQLQQHVSLSMLQQLLLVLLRLACSMQHMECLTLLMLPSMQLLPQFMQSAAECSMQVTLCSMQWGLLVQQCGTVQLFLETQLLVLLLVACIRPVTCLMLELMHCIQQLTRHTLLRTRSKSHSAASRSSSNCQVKQQQMLLTLLVELQPQPSSS